MELLLEIRHQEYKDRAIHHSACLKVLTKQEYDFVFRWQLQYDNAESGRDACSWTYPHSIKSVDQAFITEFKRVYDGGLNVGPGDVWNSLWMHCVKQKEESEKRDIQHAKEEKMRLEGKACRLYHVTRDRSEEDDGDHENTYDVEAFVERYKIRDGSELADLMQLRDGDLVDTDGYRGIGLWLFMGTTLRKTQGEYGYFIPAAGFCKVMEHGLQYYENGGAQFVMIPHSSTIRSVGPMQRRRRVEIAYSYGTRSDSETDSDAEDEMRTVVNGGQYALPLYMCEDREHAVVDGRRFNHKLAELF